MAIFAGNRFFRVKEKIYTVIYVAPCGRLLLGECGGRLCLCVWRDEGRAESLMRRAAKVLNAEFVEGKTAVLETAARELDEYFSGKRKSFDIPLACCGTEFQRSVWNAVRDVPFGETESYSCLAERIGRPQSVRAAANAVGANALVLFVPCHRITGSGNNSGGYNGGIHAKRFLLSLESESQPIG